MLPRRVERSYEKVNRNDVEVFIAYKLLRVNSCALLQNSFFGDRSGLTFTAATKVVPKQYLRQYSGADLFK